jgi:hypothetical protein
MRQALSRKKDRCLSVSKKEEGPGGTRETDPLLVGADRRTSETHQGSVRSRHSSRSPALRDSLMDPGVHGDRYEINAASGTYNSTDAYELHNDTVSPISQAQHTRLGRESSFNTRNTPSTTSDERNPFQLRRTNLPYRPPPSDHSSQQPLNDEPPLLEIPEEIYAVRKAALQVMKPLIGSWVSPLKPLFCITQNHPLIFSGFAPIELSEMKFCVSYTSFLFSGPCSLSYL